MNFLIYMYHFYISPEENDIIQYSVLGTGRYFILTFQVSTLQNGQTLKQFVGKLLTNCLSVFDLFVGLALKGLTVTGVGVLQP